MSDPFRDHFIVERVLNGDREAFRELVEKYQGTVYRIAYSMCGNAEEAHDTVQEVFYRAFRNLASYQTQWAFTTWIRRITVNYMLDQRKKKRVLTQSITTEDDTVMDFTDETHDPRKDFMEEQKQKMVFNAINQLPEKYREVLVLRHIEDLSYEEIAQTLAMPLGTVMTHIHRARTKLAELLKPVQTEIMA